MSRFYRSRQSESNFKKAAPDRNNNSVRPMVLGFGNNEQTSVWLQRAYDEHSAMLQFAKVNRFLDPLRSDPRFNTCSATSDLTEPGSRFSTLDRSLTQS